MSRPDRDADEAWGFEWGSADGNGGFVRLALHRRERTAWFWAYLLRPEGGPVVVRDHEVMIPRGGALEIRAEALWAELVCETPGEHWSIGLEAFGVRLDDADDALHGEIGERIALGFDFEWETTGARFVSELDGVTSEEQPGVVRGEVLLGRDRTPLDTVGRFEHSTGPADAHEPAVGSVRSTVAWDGGDWWSLRRDADRTTGAQWVGLRRLPLASLDASGLAMTMRSVAVIPLGDRVVTRELGTAAFDDRVGVGWMESVAPPRAKIT